MKTEIEVTKIFVYYVRSALIRRSFQLYREQLNQIEAIPYDTWLIERLMKSETPQLLERMSFNDIWHMEDFVDNDQLSIALSELNIRQKFILYWKFVENASDYQIGELLGVSGQTISQQRRYALSILADRYFSS